MIAPFGVLLYSSRSTNRISSHEIIQSREMSDMGIFFVFAKIRYTLGKFGKVRIPFLPHSLKLRDNIEVNRSNYLMKVLSFM
jgi:hypothetical protein